MEILTATAPVPYSEAVLQMEARVAGIHQGVAPDLLWLLEHPPLYTAGTSADPVDLRNPQFPVFETGRGGQYTYHGPSQRVAYVMLNLKKRQQTPDIKKYVWQLEEWIIQALASFGIAGERRPGRVGIWVVTPTGEAKIAAVGVRIRHWVTYHGISINLDPDLSHFAGIVPCGIAEHGVTSFRQLGVRATMQDLDRALLSAWGQVFGDKVGADLGQRAM
ncbi:MAG: lipoyl(octanoyl) transferase LipB [Micavibrio sp.]